jgi:hypothetical protein
MFRFMKPWSAKKFIERNNSYIVKMLKSDQQLRRFGNRLWSRILNIPYNIHKCLCLLLALLPVIGFDLKILWPLIIANYTRSPLVLRLPDLLVGVCETSYRIGGKVTVNQSNYRSWQALGILGDWGSQILKQSAHKGDKVVNPMHRPPLPPGNIIFLILISVRGWVDPRAIVWPEGFCHWSIPVTPLGIDPATFRFVARCLNQCRIRGSSSNHSESSLFVY